MHRLLLALSLLPAVAATAAAQAPARGGEPAPRPVMSIEDYEPRSMLKVPETILTRSKYPFVDVHGHQRLNIEPARYDSLVREMDELNMGVMINLSGRHGDALADGVRNFARHPGRVLVFANIDFLSFDEPGWGERAAAQLEADVRAGAKGLKVFKQFGMDFRDRSGERVRVDDPRVDPVWRKAGELGIPVLIHTGEPPAFFLPVDEHNERWLELTQFPNRRRPADRYPSFDSLMAEQHRLFRRHPETTFINAHLGWYGADLARLGALMDSIPNMYTELGAVIYELGRQPRFAREFLVRYQDRVLMGKDTYGQDEYHVYFRVLETDDEYFDYYRKRHAFWKMYGLALPDEVLRKIYYGNALRIIPGMDRSLFPE